MALSPCLPVLAPLPSTMAIPLGTRHAHDFDQPLGLLSDCHRRIESFLAVLLRVADQAEGGSLSPPQRQALETALTYFRSAAPRHTEDEEHSLFPRLRQSDDPRVRAALARIQALEADHRSADAAHQEIEALGQQWLDRNQLPSDATQRLRQLLISLQDLYRRHIDIEDRDIFPLASRILSQDALAAVGQEMARRRNLSSPPLSRP